MNCSLSVDLSISCVVDPAISTVNIKTISSTANNVHILFNQLHSTVISGLVVVLEITSNDFTDNCQNILKAVIIMKHAFLGTSGTAEIGLCRKFKFQNKQKML